jgi:hypothetical protein
VIARRPQPAPGALARARALLLTLAADGDSGPLSEATARLERWQALAAICDSGWLPITRRPSTAALRLARRHLRLLGSAPAPFTVLAEPQRGDPVHLRGLCARLPGSAARHELWRVQVVDDADGHWLVEEGHDFLLTGPDGAVVQVLADEGRLLGGPVLRVGDEASVYGFVDQIPDATGLGATRRRGGVMPALRGDSELPLLVGLFGRYAEEGNVGP